MYKKMLIFFLMMTAAFAFAQKNQTNNGWGNSDNSYNSNNNYSNSTSNNNSDYNNDNNDYPDDYYYDYPTDYYPQTYYESYYNDYRNSIVSINWQQFYRRYNLSQYQVNQIIYLNDRYQNFDNWNYYYGSNPDRWYYERFNALQLILGPQIFISFRNNYYHGYSPVVYFQNYRRAYYVPRFHVRNEYRTVNIINYRVNRNTYVNPRASNSLHNVDHRGSSENSGFRNGTKSESTQPNRNSITSGNAKDSGFRTEVKSETLQPLKTGKPSEDIKGNGFRNVEQNGNMQSVRNIRSSDNARTNSFKTGSSNQKVENAGPRRNDGAIQNARSAKREASANRKVETSHESSDSRGGGFR